ncbi:MAG TPA: FG-GAP-like repeat-containing protein [Pyrinomonadaceae bacterium]
MKSFFAAGVLVFSVVLLTAGIWFTTFAGNQPGNSGGALSLEQRAVYQQKIEAVYWRHRVWNNPQPKPPLEEVLPLAAIRAKVEDNLQKSNALETVFNRPVTPEQLRAEVERTARQTRNPEMLRELFAALGNDAFLIAEILARPVLTETFLKDLYLADRRFQPEIGKEANGELESPGDEAAFENWWREHKNEFGTGINILAQSFELPNIAPAVDDTWEPMVTTPAGGADSTSVWTGVEVIIWNGGNPMPGSRYNPALDMTFPISRTNAPLNRTRHTAVWTGQEMIIWGGYSGAAPFDAFRAGWKYNPTTDAWTQTSLTNAPEARDDHVAVWTGQEMIVWGGWTPTGVNLNSGGRYNPSNDTWTPTSQLNAPSGRLRATAVWTGAEMIVWGGTISNVGSQNTGGRYNPATNSWTATSTSNAPEPRFNHTAVWTGTEMIVWGGNSSGAIFNTGGRYNPATDSWTSLPIPALEPRRLHTAVWTGTEMIVWGGCIDFQCSISREDGSRYNPATNAWTPTAQIVGNNRSRHSAVWTGTEMIIAGGCRGGECQIRVTNIIRYNPSANSWREARVEPIATPRQPHQAVWTGTEMLVWGIDASVFDTNVYRFNPTINRWTRTIAANAPDARSDFSLVWTVTEMIVWGGDVQGIGVTRTGARFNPTTNTWTPTTITNAPTSRFLHSAVWTGTEMIVWSGLGGNLITTRTGSRYNPANDTWTAITTTSAPAGRIFPTAVWTGTEMIVWGGNELKGVEATEYFNTGGRYNPSTNTWTATSLVNAPAARTAHTAVWTGTEMIVWGGHTDANIFNSGGRYNPAADVWTPTSLTDAPSPRWIHSAIWTGAEMIVWGGIINNAFPFQSTNTGGRYNPTTGAWRPTTLVKAPDRRDGHTAVWTGSQMIIWGGVRDPESLYTNTGGIYNVETAQPSRTTYDFDGDGKSDIGVFRQGTWYLQQSQAGFTAVQFGISTDKLVPADYDGDGKTDFGVYRDGTWYLLRSTTGFTGFQFGQSGDIPQTGDFDADGKADLAVFRPADGVWYLQRSTNGFAAVRFGQNGDKPVAADYDGDGKTDAAVYRPAGGVWYVLRSRDGFTAAQFGISSDKAVAGDYDGDRKADYAVYRDGTWYLLRSSQGFTAVQFGIDTDIPAPADYDGDGKTDLAVFRNGTWYLQQSTAGFAGAQFGQANDIPVSSSSVP